jgi:hypothetical protein
MGNPANEFPVLKTPVGKNQVWTVLVDESTEILDEGRP